MMAGIMKSGIMKLSKPNMIAVIVNILIAMILMNIAYHHLIPHVLLFLL